MYGLKTDLPQELVSPLKTVQKLRRPHVTPHPFSARRRRRRPVVIVTAHHFAYPRGTPRPESRGESEGARRGDRVGTGRRMNRAEWIPDEPRPGRPFHPPARRWPGAARRGRRLPRRFASNLTRRCCTKWQFLRSAQFDLQFNNKVCKR